MNKRQVDLLLKAVTGALTGLTAFSALGAEQWGEAVVYTYQGQALTHLTISGRDGTSNFDVNEPGVAFSVMVNEPIQAGQTFSFSGSIGLFHNEFTGVMGQSGFFESWSYQSCDIASCRFSTNSPSSNDARDSFIVGTSGLPTYYNQGAPGVWNQAVVATGPNNYYLVNSAFPVAWVSPVPEVNASMLALLGLAAVGALARRKAKAQAEAQTD